MQWPQQHREAAPAVRPAPQCRAGRLSLWVLQTAKEQLPRSVWQCHACSPTCHPEGAAHILGKTLEPAQQEG